MERTFEDMLNMVLMLVMFEIMLPIMLRMFTQIMRMLAGYPQVGTIRVSGGGGEEKERSCTDIYGDLLTFQNWDQLAVWFTAEGLVGENTPKTLCYIDSDKTYVLVEKIVINERAGTARIYFRPVLNWKPCRLGNLTYIDLQIREGASPPTRRVEHRVKSCEEMYGTPNRFSSFMDLAKFLISTVLAPITGMSSYVLMPAIVGGQFIIVENAKVLQCDSALVPSKCDMEIEYRRVKSDRPCILGSTEKTIVKDVPAFPTTFPTTTSGAPGHTRGGTYAY